MEIFIELLPWSQSTNVPTQFTYLSLFIYWNEESLNYGFDLTVNRAVVGKVKYLDF